MGGVSTAVFSDVAIKRARTAITKRMQFRSRPKMFIQQHVVKEMLLYATDVIRDMVMLFLATYIFLLRLPSEALPMVWVKSRPGETQ